MKSNKTNYLQQSMYVVNKTKSIRNSNKKSSYQDFHVNGSSALNYNFEKNYTSFESLLKEKFKGIIIKDTTTKITKESKSCINFLHEYWA